MGTITEFVYFSSEESKRRSSCAAGCAADYAGISGFRVEVSDTSAWGRTRPAPAPTADRIAHLLGLHEKLSLSLISPRLKKHEEAEARPAARANLRSGFAGRTLYANFLSRLWGGAKNTTVTARCTLCVCVIGCVSLRVFVLFKRKRSKLKRFFYGKGQQH